jgi:putative FmdB family regulatory protein
VPTYQYVCTRPEEKHEFEVVQSFSDPAVASCPECASPVRKVYGSVGVVFKGSGFYRTDSRKSENSSTPPAGKDSASAPSSASTPTTAPSATPSSTSGSNSKAAD